MQATELQTLTAHQRRIQEIDAAIKQTAHFLDHKAYLVDANGNKVLLSIDELTKMRAEEELAIVKAMRQ